MASAGPEKELKCSLCLHLYTDPVVLRCGHNFCQICIYQVLITQDRSGVYFCPECREEFQERPSLVRNITLCNVVKNFWSNRGEDASIPCTYCVDPPAPAVRSCLHCEASLCANHLRVHSKRPEHILADPSTSLQTKKCSAHKELLKYYCTEDAACICVSCSLIGEHQGHKVELLDEAFGKKKEKLRNVLQKLITNRIKTRGRVENLEERRRKLQDQASREAEKATALLMYIRRRLDDLEKGVLRDLSRREERLSQSLSDVIQNLEIKKDELSRKMRHIGELCNMTDPLTVLQEPDTGELCDLEEERGDEDTGGRDEDDWGAEIISHISQTLSDIIRGVCVAYVTYAQTPVDFLLDINTADNNLLISDDLKTATWTRVTQNRPETAERFQCNQVMSRRGFTSGRHYWDVEISKSGLWSVGMCYPSIDRRGRQSHIGDNNKSWCLGGGSGPEIPYSVMHDSKVIPLPHQISSDGVRICLDYEAGLLSLYELCDPIRHLHTFTATFTEPLHAVLCVHNGFINISGSSR
ncbi:E3 ubiquitin/ISG15 ligase TRIM25-like [Phyllobates terribilis]|uniref:E3 ubiquitin/ISG15 ligase TRIM25-like n=1 Tax=Phyllobates terribilis TaxID=111132 RepID=UPI003CCAE767